MSRGKGWFWTREKLEELIGIMKEESDTPDLTTGSYVFRGRVGLARRLVAPYDKVDSTVSLMSISGGLQLLVQLEMLEPGQAGVLPADYERRFTPRPVTEDMIAQLKEWKASYR